MLLFVSVSSYGQINTPKYSVGVTSNDMGPCGGANDGVTTVAIKAKQNTANTFKIAFDLPDGINYKTGTATITNMIGSLDFTISEFDVSDLNAPIFSLERNSNSNWQTNDEVTFTFGKTGDCDAVQFSYASGIFKDKHTITFIDSDGNNSNSDTDETVNAYDFLRPYLTVSDDFVNIETTMGEPTSRNVPIENSGNGSLSNFTHTVSVGADIINYDLYFNSTLLAYTTSGLNRVYNIDLSVAPFAGAVGDGDALFENETIALEERFTLNACNDDLITHTPSWGCGATICQNPDPSYGEVKIRQNEAQLSFTDVQVPNQDFGQTNTYIHTLSNDSSTDTAYNVHLNIGLGTENWIETTINNNALWGSDYQNNRNLSNFKLNGNNITPTRLAYNETSDPRGLGSYYVPENFFASDPDGPGGFDDLDGDGFYDDLGPNATTDISFDLDMVLTPNVCNDEDYNSILSYEQLNIDAFANNSCAVQETVREYIEDSSMVSNWVRTSPPADTNNNEGFSLKIESSFSFYDRDVLRCNGNSVLTDNPNTFYETILTVPSGVSLNGSPAGFSQSGNIITYKTSDLPNSDNYVRILADFPLIVDCDVYTGNETITASYTIKYTNDCFDIDLFCGSTSFNTHCPRFIAGCSGPTTTSFQAERETAGWTDDSQTQLVTLSSTDHYVKRYLAKDEMKITTSAVMRDYSSDNLYLDITYDTDTNNTVNADIVSFLNGSITINDLSSGSPQTQAINIAPVLTTNGNDQHKLTFDLSSYRSLISGTYEYGEGLEEDEISLELHFVFKDDFRENELFELTNFTAEFFSLDNANTKVFCDKYYEAAEFFKTASYIYDISSKEISRCEERYISASLVEDSPTHGDVFPNEFRSSNKMTSVQFTLPDGIEYLNFATLGDDYPELQPSGEYPNSDNGGLNVSVSGNIVTVTPTALVRQNPIRSWNSKVVDIRVRANPDALENSDYLITLNYEEYSHSSSPIQVSENHTTNITTHIPQIQITPINNNVQGNSLTESFEFEVCNIDSRSSTEYTWLRVNALGFTTTAAFLDESGTENPANFTQIGDNIYIEIGEYSAWSDTCKKVRLEASYTNCSSQLITTDIGWDCDSYPSDFSTSSSYITSAAATINFEPKPAAIQFSLLDQPTNTVDMCSDYTIQLEYRNAGEGNLIAPTYSFDVPGNVAGLDILDIEVEYPRNSGITASITPTISGNIVTVNLEGHPGITASDGIKGSFDAANIDEQIAIITMLLNPQCDYISNTGSTYEAHGNNPCGQPAVGNGSRITTNPLIITGAEPPYVANNAIVSNLGNINGCVSETVSVETLIVDGSTGAVDYVTVTLPQGIEYVASSFISTSALQATFLSVTTQGNQQIVEVGLPDGAPSGSKIEYEFDILSTFEACAGPEIIELNSYVTTNNLFCNGVSCGTTKIVTGYNTADITVVKPIIGAIGSATATYIQTNPGNNFYEIDYELENTGAIDLAPGSTYNVYCADASNNIIGSSIASGTINQTISAGNSINDKITFNSASFCGDKIIVEFLPSATNCFCDPVLISIDTAPSTNYADLELTLVPDNANPNIGDTVTYTVSVENKGLIDANNVEIETVIPQGYTVATINNGGSQSGNTITWPSFGVVNGTTVSFTFTATINAPTGTVDEHLIMAQVTAVDEIDPDSTPNNFDGAATLEDDEAVLNISIDEADLSITKSTSATSPSAPNVGDTLSFEVTLTNNGAEAATNIEIVDTIPAGYTVTNGTISNGGTILGNTITWNIASLNSSNSILLTYDVVVNAPTGAADHYVNVVEVTAVDQFDPDSTPNNFDGTDSLEDDEAFFDCPTVQRLDMDLSKTLSAASNSNPNVGETITFEVTLNNNGPNDATNVQIEDIIPVGYTLDASSISNGGTATGSTILWDIATLTASTNIVLTYDVSVNAPTGAANEYQNIAQVKAADQYDTDSTPDNFDGIATLEDDEAVFTLGGTPSNDADLEASMTVSDNNPNTGDTVTFTITILNNGPVDATNIAIENYVPAGYAVTGIGQGGSQTGNDISWPLFDLTNGNSTTFTFTATVNSPTGSSDEFQNVAEVVGVDQPDPDSTPNNFDGVATLEDDEAVVNITAQESDLSLSKGLSASSNSAPNVGETITFEITLTNNGASDATNIQIGDMIPVGFTLDASSISNGGTATGNTILWNITSVTANTNIVLTYIVFVNAPTGAANEYQNIAQVKAADQFDPDSTPNNFDDVATLEDDEAVFTLGNTPSNNADLEVDLAVSNMDANINDTVTFTITVLNNGPVDATNIAIENYVPAGYTVSSVGQGGSQSGNDISWPLFDLANGSSTTFTFTATVNSPTGAADEYQNIAEVVGVDQPDPDSTPNNFDGIATLEDDEAVVEINSPSMDIEISKTADKTDSFLDDTVIFTISATNHGTFAATKISIDEALPNGFAYVSSVASNGIYNETLGEWTIASLASNETATLDITVTVVDGTDYTNIATLSFLDQVDIDSSNDSDSVTISITQSICLTVYNEFSPNGDGTNEVFYIECIEKYPNNNLQIFNRWGNKVYEKNGYDNTWDGTSMGRATINQEQKVPIGTYYYILDCRDGKTPQKTGWLYVTR